MADIDLKISILKKSMSTFSGWLDRCEELINALPTQLEQCDHAHLRELAMKYKVYKSSALLINSTSVSDLLHALLGIKIILMHFNLLNY